MQRHFHEELDALKQTLLAMGGLVEDQIRRVMIALLERDGDLAQEVIDRDRQVNAYDVEIERLSLWYGAKQALKNVSMAVPKHRVTAYIGPSGCG